MKKRQDLFLHTECKKFNIKIVKYKCRHKRRHQITKHTKPPVSLTTEKLHPQGRSGDRGG